MRMEKKRSEKQEFYRMIFFLALPIVGQNLINTAVSSADTVMLGFVSQEALAAVSLAGNIHFVLFLFMFGLATGSSMLASQYWGKGDIRTIEKVLGIALRFSLSVSLVFTMAALIAPSHLMRLFTPDEALISHGAVYLRIVSFTYLFSGFTVLYLNIMRCMERVTLSTAVYLISFLLNVSLNACFIFVLRLGVTGVALATLISRLTELLLCLGHAALNKKFRTRVSDIFAGNKLLLGDFIKYSMPAIGNDIMYGIGFTMYSVIIGHLSSDAVAAYAIVAIARNLGTVLCFGAASATSIIMGKTLGANDMKNAEVYAGRMLRLAVWTALAGGALILAVMPVLLRLGDLTDLARFYLKWMLLMNTYYVLGQSVNTCLICGIFRSGGDSKFGLICDSITHVGIMIPLGFLCAFIFKLPVMAVYFVLCLDEFIKMPTIIRHYRKKGWLKNITREIAD